MAVDFEEMTVFDVYLLGMIFSTFDYTDKNFGMDFPEKKNYEHYETFFDRNEKFFCKQKSMEIEKSYKILNASVKEP